MCGRYAIAKEPREIEEHFGAKFAEPMRPRYNAAPSQRLPVILNADPRSIVLSPWGIKLPWLKRDGLINVRAETLREKRTFQKDLADRRCLIPADGFYEWQVRPGGKKSPYRIVRRDDGLFASAGIWEVQKEGALCNHHHSRKRSYATDPPADAGHSHRGAGTQLALRRYPGGRTSGAA